MAVRSLRQNGDTFSLWAAASLIVFLFLLFLLMLSLSIWRDWRDAEARASDRALAASQVVATNARWIAELSRQALSRIDEALGTDIHSNVSDTEALIRDAIGTLPGNVRAYVVDADGRTLFSTDPDVKPIDVRDRDYFAALAKGEYWYFSPLLISRLNGAQIFVVSKRLTRAGSFAGAAIISYDVMLLKDTWESLGLDDVSTVSLIRSDGQLVARYPLADGPLDLSKYVLFTDYLRQSDVGTYSTVSPADGVSRIVGYRRVPTTPYVALASLSTESAFALFRRNTFVTLAFALPAVAALAGAIAWIIRLLRRDQLRREQLSNALELNQMLVKDTHHRVKNNLQTVMSMVRMHRLPADLKSDMQSRIAAMAAVHESLYRLDQVSDVEASELLPRIVDPLREAYALPVAVDYNVDEVLLDRDSATPIALVVSEVVTNALKYAFPDGRAGKLSVGLTQKPSGGLSLVIADNGVGFDPGAGNAGMGTRLINAMVLQLGGSYSYTRADGTVFEATLPPSVQPIESLRQATAAE